jgi:hypothetical protein
MFERVSHREGAFSSAESTTGTFANEGLLRKRDIRIKVRKK